MDLSPLHPMRSGQNRQQDEWSLLSLDPVFFSFFCLHASIDNAIVCMRMFFVSHATGWL